VGEPAGSKETAKRCTEAIRHERLRMQARAKRKRDSAQPQYKGAAINNMVGPTLMKVVSGERASNFFTFRPVDDLSTYATIINLLLA